MRAFILYLVAGIFAVLALDVIAPPLGLGLTAGAWAVTERDPIPQTVDRARKSDRLAVPTAVRKKQEPRKTPAVLVGCEPVFSPLSASARANFAGRCVAENGVNLTRAG
jgi:hypothetical protein